MAGLSQTNSVNFFGKPKRWQVDDYIQLSCPEIIIQERAMTATKLNLPREINEMVELTMEQDVLPISLLRAYLRDVSSGVFEKPGPLLTESSKNSENLLISNQEATRSGLTSSHQRAGRHWVSEENQTIIGRVK